MAQPALPRLKDFMILPLLAALLAGACAQNSEKGDIADIPLSPELRPALEESRRSLGSTDQGREDVWLDVDRFYGLQQMFFTSGLQARAADSLFALWEARPSHFMWPELAARNWHLLNRGFERDGMFLHPEFSDNSTAVGAYMGEWRTIARSSRGEGMRRAWGMRDSLDALQQFWLEKQIIWLERWAGRDAEATRLALEALPRARELGGRSLEMVVWSDIASSLMLGDHLDDAFHAVRMAEALAAEINADTGNVYILQRLMRIRADLLAARHETQAALDLYTACVDSALAHGMSYYAGLHLNRAGILTSGTGDYELGLRLYRQCLDIALAEGDSLNIPIHLMNISRRHRLLGRLDSCLVYQRRAERWLAAYPEPGNVARMPLQQAEYYAQIGDYATVDSLLTAAAGMLPNKTNVQALAELHTRMIEEGMERGRPDLAYQSISVLDSLRGRLGSEMADRNVDFDLDLHSSDFFSRQGQFTRAVESLERAAASLERRPDPKRQWQLTKMRGTLARHRADLTSAEEAFRACVALSEERQDQDRLATSRFLLGSVLLDQQRFAETRQLFPADVDTNFGGRFRTRLSVLLLRAISFSREGRLDEALGELAKARRLCTPWSPPDLLNRIDLETGRAQAAAGRIAAAREEYNRVQQRLAAGDHSSASDVILFIESDIRRDLVEAWLELAFIRGQETAEGEAALRALRHAIAVLPGWRLRESSKSSEFAPNQLIYFVGREASCRWFIGEKSACMMRLPAEDELVEQLAPVLADLSQPGRLLVKRDMETLIAVLGGAPSAWRGETALRIIPDGVLYAIPWGALPWPGSQQRTWLDQGALILADTPLLSGAPAAMERRGEGRLLALGVDGSIQVDAARMSTLHHAEREAHEIVGHWPAERATLRLGAEANWAELDWAELAEFSVIHIASHALVYQGAADQTTLLLAGSADDPLTSGEIGGLDLRADLVFLSCCEAAEDFGRGRSPAHAGLARSFLAAGARTVVAPSIRIDDEAARRIAGRFYDHWLAGLPAAEALRRAQLDLKHGDECWSHPFYWAFYQAISSGGDPKKAVSAGRRIPNPRSDPR